MYIIEFIRHGKSEFLTLDNYDDAKKIYLDMCYYYGNKNVTLY